MSEYDSVLAVDRSVSASEAADLLRWPSIASSLLVLLVLRSI